MNILQQLSNSTLWCKVFKQKKAYLEGLEVDTITLQEKKLAEYKRLLDFAQDNYNREKLKLEKYTADRESLRKWVPENQPQFDRIQVVLSDKVQKAAEKVAKAAKDLPSELGQDQVV